MNPRSGANTLQRSLLAGIPQKPRRSGGETAPRARQAASVSAVLPSRSAPVYSAIKTHRCSRASARIPRPTANTARPQLLLLLRPPSIFIQEPTRVTSFFAAPVLYGARAARAAAACFYDTRARGASVFFGPTPTRCVVARGLR